MHTPCRITGDQARPLLLHLGIAITTVVLAACGGSSGGGGSDGTAAGAGTQSAPPIASLIASASEGVEPLTVTFDASASRDPDGRIERFELSQYGPGGGSATGPNPIFGPVTYPAGEYSVGLRVIDNSGNASSTTVVVRVTPGPRGNLDVRFKDSYGVGVPGMQVGAAGPAWMPTYFTVTDADGTARFKNLVAGPNCVGFDDDWGGVYPCNRAVVEPDRRTTQELDYAYPTGRISGMVVTRSRIVDGDTLELDSEMFLIDNGGSSLDFLRAENFELRSCNSNLARQGDCIARMPGETWSGSGYAKATADPESFRLMPARETPERFYATLLVDVARATAQSYGQALRLHGIKDFLQSHGVGNRVALGAYGADATTSAAVPERLPGQPLTLFPVGNPAFAEDGARFLGDVDSLFGYSGGASPMFAALDQALDFTSSHAPESVRRVVVVLAEGDDDTCGTPDQCRTLMQAALAKSAATDVDVMVVAQSATRGPLSAPLGLGGRGGYFEVLVGDSYSSELTLLRRLAPLLEGRLPSFRATYRVTATEPGAFRAGRQLKGMVVVKTNDSLIGHLPFTVVL